MGRQTYREQMQLASSNLPTDMYVRQRSVVDWKRVKGHQLPQNSTAAPGRVLPIVLDSDLRPTYQAAYAVV